MSDTTEVIQSTIDKVLARVDILASKLGIAAAEVWKFTVKAKAVQARADFAKGAAMLLLPMAFWGWSLHVAMSKIPHDVEVANDYKFQESAPMPCDQVGNVNGKQVILHESCYHQEQIPVARNVEKGISDVGWGLIVSALVTFGVGLIFAICGIDTLIDGFAATKTAEYDAYQDLIYDWKD